MSSFKLLIVNFHYFREETYGGGIYPVSKALFLKQIDVLSQSFTFCSQDEITNWLNADSFPARRYCLITFDDGLAEQMQAFELLQRNGVPAVFYVPAAPYLFDNTLTVHKLHHIRSVLDDETLIAMLKENSLFDSYPVDEGLLYSQYRYDDDQARRIKYFFNFILSDVEADQTISEIFSRVVTDQVSFRKNLYMKQDDLVTLACHQMLGSHGRDHKPLATLSDEACHSDIFDSLKFFENIAGFPIASFSYPYGSKAAVNDVIARKLVGTSVRFALTMFRGTNSEEDLRSRFLLKRVDTNDAPGGKHPLKELI